MSIGNIVESSCQIVGNYFLEEQQKRDDENRNKMLVQITKMKEMNKGDDAVQDAPNPNNNTGQ